MERLLVLLALAAGAGVVAAVVRHRLGTDAPTRPAWVVPDHVDRADLDRPEAPWMVAVFSSATCLACRATWEKARQLESDDVAVQDIDAVADKALHERYGVDAVPLLLVLGPDGTVRASFLGEPSAADLWSAVADVREAAG
ncbi:MAG TPA: hypothetical protein VFU19_01565 [Iamia sp.]|nr:hypothetical protein [Iamia sp.]